MASLRKNVASQNVTFTLISATTGAAVTGASVTVYVTKDGTQAAGGGTVTELKVSGTGYGAYNYAPTQAETNASNVGLLFLASGAIPVNYNIWTDVVDANGYPSVNVVDIAGTANAGVAGYVGIDWSKVTNPTSTVGLSGTTVGTITTYTGDTPQTGDSYAVVNSGTYGNSALHTQIGTPATSSALSTLQTTANTINTNTTATAGYVTGAVALESEAVLIYNIVNSGSYGNSALLAAVQNVQNNTFIATSIPQNIQTPASGSATINISIVFANAMGAAANLDSGDPIIALVNDAGTDLSGRLGSWTNPATGKYVIPYTSTSSDATEGLHWDVSGTVNLVLRRMVAYTQIVDTVAVDFTSTDRTNLGTILTNVGNLVSGADGVNVSAVNGVSTSGVTTVNAVLGQAYTIGVNAAGKISEVALVDTLTTYTGNTPQTGDSFTRIGATGSGLTSLAPASTALSTAVWTAPPTGFLAATFPSGTIANTTNIAGGTIANLTNAPTSGDLTAAMKSSVTTAASAATPVATISGTLMTLDALATHGDSTWATATGFATPTNITAGTITTVTNLTNAPTTGDFTATMKTSLNAATPASVQNISAQTGDAYAIVSNGTYGNSAIHTQISALQTTANTINTNTFTTAGYVTGPVALESEAVLIYNIVNSGSYGNAALSTQMGNLQTHGDSAWTTATGFATPTNITAGTITTVTNLTNAPTAGDFTATMKTSIGTAVAASAVASVTGNVGGSVGSISGVTFPTNFSLLAINGSGFVTFSNTGVATATEISNLQTHGDSAWATATGFATAAAIVSLQTHGDATWATATGFAVPGSPMDLVNAPNATALNAAADALLIRDWSTTVILAGQPARFSLMNAGRKLANKVDSVTTTGYVSIFREDSATIAYTQAVIVSAAAELATSVG